MSIYSHFRPEEKEFIDKILGFKYDVEANYAPKLLDFLDPREQEITRLLIGNQEIKVSFFGGSPSSERKRAIIYPNYFIPTEDDFGILLLQINYPAKFVTIEHPQVLGSLMSIGVKREKFGDILVVDDQIQLVVAKELENFILLNFEQIGKTKISLKKLPFSSILTIEENWKQRIVICSSLRLDTILHSIFNISRATAQELIAGKKVKVNFKLVELSHFECQEGDVLSVRGFGRAKIFELGGQTKKDKFKLVIGTH